MDITLRIELPLPSANCSTPRVEVIRIDAREDGNPPQPGHPPEPPISDTFGTGLHEALRTDRRARIVRLLKAAPEHTANDQVLRAALADLGHVVCWDLLRNDLAYLLEMGTIALYRSARDRQLFIARLQDF